MYTYMQCICIRKRVKCVYSPIYKSISIFSIMKKYHKHSSVAFSEVFTANDA